MLAVVVEGAVRELTEPLRSARAANRTWKPDRLAPFPAAGLLGLMLDEVDYGMVLTQGLQVLHANHAARTELQASHPLQLHGDELQAGDADDHTLLQDALLAAGRGLRRLLSLGQGAHRCTAAVVPLHGQGWPSGHGLSPTLVMLGKRQVCERLSVEWFARAHALTPAETRVLEALCQGFEPKEMADRFAVGLATVRTQIGSIRAKTGADSIRTLVRKVAMLPPMVSSLRPTPTRAE